MLNHFELILIDILYVCVYEEYVNPLTQEATPSYVALKNHISRIFFHDNNRTLSSSCSKMYNQVIWNSFTH